MLKFPKISEPLFLVALSRAFAPIVPTTPTAIAPPIGRKAAIVPVSIAIAVF